MRYVSKSLIILTTVLKVAESQIEYVGDIQLSPIAENAQLISIAANYFGDIYVLDSKNHEIYRANFEGKVLNRNGGYGWEAGRFDTPTDIGIGSGLDVVVADYNNHRLVRFDRFLNYIGIFPSSVSGTHQMTSYGENDKIIRYPLSLAVSNLGEIYVLDNENIEVVRIDTEKGEYTRFGGVGYGNYSLKDPLRIRIDDRNNVYVLEKSARLLVFDRFGAPVKIVSRYEKVGLVDFIVIKNHIIFINSPEASSPSLLIYNLRSSKWEVPSIAGDMKGREFISGCAVPGFLLLLDRSGLITIWDIESLYY